MTEAMPQGQQPSRMEQLKNTLYNNRVVAIGATVVALAGGALGFARGGETTPANAAAAPQANIAGLEGFKDYTANANNFTQEDVLPNSKGGLDVAEDVPKYLKEISEGSDGPFGQFADKNSLALFDAVLIKQAHDGEAPDPKFNVQEAFKDSKAAFDADGGLELAKKKQKELFQILDQCGRFEDQWAVKGDKLVKYAAIRDDKYNVTGVATSQRVALDNIGGIVCKFPKANTAGKLDGWNEFIITDKGAMYSKGITVEAGVSKDKKKEDSKGSSNKSEKDNKGDAKSDNKETSSQGKANQGVGSETENDQNPGEAQDDKDGNTKGKAPQGGSRDTDGDKGKSPEGNGKSPSGSNGGGSGKKPGKGPSGTGGGGGSGSAGGEGGGSGGGENGSCGGGCSGGGSGGAGGSGGGSGGGCSTCGAGGGGNPGGGGSGGGENPPPPPPPAGGDGGNNGGGNPPPPVTPPGGGGGSGGGENPPPPPPPAGGGGGGGGGETQPPPPIKPPIVSNPEID